MSEVIRIDAVIYENRDSLIFNEEWGNPPPPNGDGEPQDLTGALVTGAIKNELSDTSTLATLTFDNDLPNGIIKAYLAEADYDAVANGISENTGYYDVSVKPLGDLKAQAYSGQISAAKTAAP